MIAVPKILETHEAVIGNRKLKIGDMLMTSGISSKQTEDEAFGLELLCILERYGVGDWGDLCEEDVKANLEALEYGNRVFAAYETTEGRVYIITEADRSATTILFANEY